jgi:membrane-associated phospholipid phosphatase
MRSARIIQAVMVVIVLAVGAAALVLARRSAAGDGDFHGAPVPALFDDAQIGTVAAGLKRAQAEGHRAAKAWLDAHPVTTDAAFAKWAVDAVGTPPGGRAPKAQLAEVRAIAAKRTPQGTTAARWLEQHGKKQPWKAIRNQTETFLARPREQRTKAALKAALKLGGRIESTAKLRYDRPPPYAIDPGLSAGGVRVDTGGGHQSYPSSHMVDAGVGITLLTNLDPHMADEYAWMADEIAYSRLYTGGHYLSDIAAGAFLGTLVGDYELRKQGLVG